MTTEHKADFSELKPRITVFGVGGAGCNAVNNMIRANLEGVEFVVANTDAQALAQSSAQKKLQMGASITEGLGAGSRPEIGCAAAEESLPEIIDNLANSHMVFITAGMGGGTGTGAGPVIARAARDQGILTVGVVTKPFHFEGARRMRIAEAGVEELQQYVDTLLIIPNQNLFRVANEKTTFADAFAMADQVLHSGVRGITDLMVMPGLINLDFADVRTVMNEMGKAMMGTGEAETETRAIDAAEAAINNPLLDEVSMKGARGVLINITGGLDLTLFEVDEAANRIRAEVDPDANIIVGSTFDEKLDGNMRVSVVATGIDAESAREPAPERPGEPESGRVSEPESAEAPARVHVMPRVQGSGWRPKAATEEVAAPPVPARIKAALTSTEEDDSVESLSARARAVLSGQLEDGDGEAEEPEAEESASEAREEPRRRINITRIAGRDDEDQERPY
ncbi:MAG: cell division protein FtsZ, partial [Alphaproteobacteria bacterium]